MKRHHIIAITIVLAACSDDSPGGRTDSAVIEDPATAHELVDCDVAAYRAFIPSLPDGAQCERACQAPEEHTGPSCTNDPACGPGCSTTIDYGGVNGCCHYNGSNSFYFCECR